MKIQTAHAGEKVAVEISRRFFEMWRWRYSSVSGSCNVTVMYKTKWISCQMRLRLQKSSDCKWFRLSKSLFSLCITSWPMTEWTNSCSRRSMVQQCPLPGEPSSGQPWTSLSWCHSRTGRRPVRQDNSVRSSTAQGTCPGSCATSPTGTCLLTGVGTTGRSWPPHRCFQAYCWIRPHRTDTGMERHCWL